MAPMAKRKAVPLKAVESPKKKIKSTESPARVLHAPTEEDSDPILESDTLSESGADDGASWPSQAGSDDEKPGAETGGLAAAESKPHPKPDGTSSRESHLKQKANAKERKAAKPNADTIARSKKLWEKLRLKSHVPLEERKGLIAELFDLVMGHVKDFVFKHDSVRVIQTALKYANQDQKKAIAAELKGEYRGLSESKYGKFLVAKLLSYGDQEIRDMVIPEFYGGVKKLIKHPEASWILDDMYRGAASPVQKAILLREWYGSEFTVFKSTEKHPSAELKKILEENPEKRTPIMRYLFELINHLIQKKTVAFTMLHDAMLQYFLNLPPGSEDFTAFISLLQSDEEHDLLRNLAFTASGSQIVCLALAHTSAKDRKLILRTYKGLFNDMSHDPNAQQIILAAYDLIDDTVLVSKLIFPDLLAQNIPSTSEQEAQLLASLTHPVSRIPLLHLSAQSAKQLLSSSTLSLVNKLHLIRVSPNSTSKKDPLARKNELLAALCPPLLQLIAAHTHNLVSNSFGAQAIASLIISAPASLSSTRDTAVEAIVSLIRESESSAATETDLKSLLEQPHASRMLKNLAQGGFYNPVTKRVTPCDPPLAFAASLVSTLGLDGILKWATGKQAFVILGMLEGEEFEGREKVVRRLREGKEELERARDEEKLKGAELLLALVSGGNDGVEKKGTGKKEGVKVKKHER